MMSNITHVNIDDISHPQLKLILHATTSPFPNLKFFTAFSLCAHRARFDTTGTLDEDNPNIQIEHLGSSLLSIEDSPAIHKLIVNSKSLQTLVLSDRVDKRYCRLKPAHLPSSITKLSVGEVNFAMEVLQSHQGIKLLEITKVIGWKRVKTECEARNVAFQVRPYAPSSTEDRLDHYSAILSESTVPETLTDLLRSDPDSTRTGSLAKVDVREL